MKTIAVIKTDLEHIRIYHRNKSWIKDPSKVVHPKNFVEIFEAYAAVVSKLPEKLLQIYEAFYVSNKTKRQIGLELGVSERYIGVLTAKLEQFFQEKINTNKG